MDTVESTRFAQVKDIFSRVVELPPEQIDPALRDLCGDDEAMEDAVRRLIRAHRSAGEFLDRPTLLPLAAVDGDFERSDAPENNDERGIPFDAIGPYRLIERLGEGGFGSVYLAEQSSPVRRQVAIKILKPGMDSRQVLARFDAERQALALMEHANIARVYDAGTTPDRRPYFVMEVVRGRPITEYCDRNRLVPRERLKLFIDVCVAVQHAHQKGVIHRDIKPANVIVTDADGQPAVKVIDFGVAKAMHASGPSGTPAVTEAMQLLGTPEYMSPEQASSGGIDIDTRSDVYSLGVLLYELMTGLTPFDGGELRRVSLAEMQRRICHDPPPRPSTRIGPGLAETRSSDPSRLRTLLRGELDWVVMKCLEKDRARRYDSAAALVDDCRAYLSGRPVSARPATRAYRIARFVGRNKLPVGAAAAVVLAMIVGLVATSAALYQAKIERDRAVSAQSAADDARALAERHVRFIEEMFASIHPEQARGREVTVREVLDEASARASGAFRDRPLVEAAVRSTFGSAYAGIGLLERGRSEFERALRLLSGSGEASTWPHLRAKYGKLLADMHLDADAQRTLREALAQAIDQFGPAHEQSIFTRGALAVLLIRVGAFDEAERLLLENLSLLGDPTDPFLRRMLLINTADLALLRHTQDRKPEARELYESAVLKGVQLLGDDHPDVLSMRLRVATLMRDQGDFAGTLDALSSVLERAEGIFGPDHPNTLMVAHQCALMMSANGRTAEAEGLLADTIARARRVLGEDHATTLFARHDLAQIWILTRRTDQAEPEMIDLIQRMTRVRGEDHRDTLMFRADLARLLTARGDYARVEAMYADILPRLERTMGDEHEYTVSVRMRLGLAMMRQQRWSDAEPLLERVYASKKRDGSWTHDWSGASSYGICLTRLGKFEPAVPVLLEAEQAMRAYTRLDRAGMRDVAGALVECFERMGDPQRAAAYRQIVEEMTASLATRPAGRSVPTTSPP